MTDDRRPRIAPVSREALSAEQLAVFDEITMGRRALGSPFPLTDSRGRLGGPFGLMALAPSIGYALQALGGAIRYNTALSPREREIAILLVAHHLGSDYETWAHTLVARQACLTDDEIDALLAGTAIGRTPRERSCAFLATAIVTRSGIGDDAFSEVYATLGETSLIELTTLVGYYTTLAGMMAVFDIARPALQ